MLKTSSIGYSNLYPNKIIKNYVLYQRVTGRRMGSYGLLLLSDEPGGYSGLGRKLTFIMTGVPGSFIWSDSIVNLLVS